MRSTARLAAVAALVLVAAACGDVAGDVPALDGCNRGDLSLVEPDTLTIATGEPMFTPWMVGDDPTNQEGFESAVAYAIAAELGFSPDDVTWIRIGMDETLVGGARPFDFDIRQHIITEEVPGAIVFSSPYYTVRQVLITNDGSPVGGAGTIEELRPFRLGAVAGSDSLAFIDDVLQPNEKPEVYETNGAAKAALDAGELDAIVVGLPAAYFVTEVEIPDTVIAGQIEPPGDEPQQFALMLPDPSPLLECINQVITTLTEDGTLASLERTWLAANGTIKTITG